MTSAAAGPRWRAWPFALPQCHAARIEKQGCGADDPLRAAQDQGNIRELCAEAQARLADASPEKEKKPEPQDEPRQR
jgi:hypothetical protein